MNWYLTVQGFPWLLSHANVHWRQKIVFQKWALRPIVEIVRMSSFCIGVHNLIIPSQIPFFPIVPKLRIFLAWVVVVSAWPVHGIQKHIKWTSMTMAYRDSRSKVSDTSIYEACIIITYLLLTGEGEPVVLSGIILPSRFCSAKSDNNWFQAAKL